MAAIFSSYRRNMVSVALISDKDDLVTPNRSRTFRSRHLGPRGLGPGSCYINGDENMLV